MQVRVAIARTACKIYSSACPLGDRLMHSEEPLRLLNLGNFGPRVETDEGPNE